MFTVLIAAIVAACVAALLACIPGLHVYNLLGLMTVGVHVLMAHGVTVPPEVLVPTFVGMVVSYAMLNTIPSVLLAAPDESAIFTVLPGQNYLLSGRGYEGTLITAAGGLAGLFLIVVGGGLLAPRIVPPAREVLRPHQHWLLWCIIAFMLLSEWPKGGTRGQGGWRKFLDGWRTTGAGLLTFALAGLFGFVLLYRSPVSHTVAFQNLMPAFVGLFTMPWLLLNIMSRTTVPPQTLACSGRLTAGTVIRGALAGGAGGAFAAFVPGVTGGVGGFLAGHATALRDDRVFLSSQGTSKLVYYVGGLLLLFIPGAGLTRGGGALMLRGLYTPNSLRDYHMALAATAVAGCVAFLLVDPLARLTLALIRRVGYRRISWGALAIVLGVVAVATHLQGLFVMAVGTGIGLIPVLFGSRRMNCLGVILLPLACNMSGVGVIVARVLRLL